MRMLPSGYIEQKRSDITPLQFVAGAISYALVSWVSFLFTSGGWSYVYYKILGGVFFIAVAIICMAMNIFPIMKGKKYIYHIDKPLLLTLILIQCTYLFNFGDCGDQPGNYTFIETVIRGTDYFCSYQTASVLAPYVMIFMPLAYITILAYFLTKMFVTRAPPPIT